MTREIALHCMKSASELERELCEECPIYGQTGCDHCYEDALAVAIEALEQEPINSVLEDIKAEINAIPIVTRHGQSGTVMTAQGMRKKLIEILDKHISRNETETWHGMHGKDITAPKGTFEKIFNENDTEDDGI